MKRLIGCVVTALLAANCAKKKDLDPPNFPAALTVGCGDDGTTNCFSKGFTLAETDGQQLTASSESQLDTMLLFLWMNVGFPAAKSDYYKSMFATDDLREIFTQDGTIARVESIRKFVSDGAVAAYSGEFETCGEAPTSGDFVVSGTTLTWQTPKLTTPLDYPAGKAGKVYDKAITGSKTDGNLTLNYRFEFFCDYNGMAFSIDMKKSAERQVKLVFFYDRDVKAKLYTDFYIYVAGGKFSDEPLNLVASLRQTGANGVKSWITRATAKGESSVMAYRYAINANTATPKISFYVTELTSSPALSAAAFEAHAAASSTSVSDGQIPASTNTNNGGAAAGCADGWSTKSQDVTSADVCSGLDLEKAPPPFWATSASSNMSMKDVYENTTKITDI